MTKLFNIFLLALFLISCKGEQKKSKEYDKQAVNNIDGNQSKKINIDCLTKKDSLLIKEFKNNLHDIIERKAKEELCNYINFPYKSGVHLIGKEDFLAGDFQIVLSYFDTNFIDKDEIEHLKPKELYVAKKDNDDCYYYYYYLKRSFPDLEFSAFFYLDKVNSEVKIVRIDFAG